jgi:hypothetical protein
MKDNGTLLRLGRLQPQSKTKGRSAIERSHSFANDRVVAAKLKRFSNSSFLKQRTVHQGRAVGAQAIRCESSLISSNENAATGSGFDIELEPDASHEINLGSAWCAMLLSASSFAAILSSNALCVASSPALYNKSEGLGCRPGEVRVQTGFVDVIEES